MGTPPSDQRPGCNTGSHPPAQQLSMSYGTRKGSPKKKKKKAYFKESIKVTFIGNIISLLFLFYSLVLFLNYIWKGSPESVSILPFEAIIPTLLENMTKFKNKQQAWRRLLHPTLCYRKNDCLKVSIPSFVCFQQQPAVWTSFLASFCSGPWLLQGWRGGWYKLASSLYHRHLPHSLSAVPRMGHSN